MDEAIGVGQDGLVETSFHDTGDAGEETERENEDQGDLRPRVELKLPYERYR